MSDPRLSDARHMAQTEPDEALALCNDVLNDHLDDDDAQKALFMSAYIMMEAQRYGLAYNLYQRCAQLNPRISEIWSNMGMCLEDNDPGKARQLFRKAQKLDPKNAHAYANEGLMCLQLGKPEECIRLSKKALELKEIDAAKHNMALAQLMMRDWAQGWKNYFETLGVKHRERRDYGLPEWDGKAEGKVVIYGEQGVGDEIMFASILSEIRNPIVLDCDRRLEKLFTRSFPFPVYGTRFQRETALLDEHRPDYQCAIGQLPHFFRNSEGSFPGTPYLTPDPERCIQWRALFDTLPGKKIGIAWNGGLRNTGELRRSFKFDDLVLRDGNTYISLEYKPHAPIPGVKQYPETLKGRDIDELAALINELDYVICPCTTVVYIAGALGKECHVLVPDKPGYRYHLSGQFPWYESVTLHRKTGTWRQTAERLDGYIHRIRPEGDSGLSRSLPLDSETRERPGIVHAYQ